MTVTVSGNRSFETEEERLIPIKSVTELIKEGIKIEKCTNGIKFVQGILQIPELVVSAKTESMLRNLMAYEYEKQPKYVTDYAFFLHCLINSPNDVEILRRHGILRNYLGDDRMVYQMFKRLGEKIFISTDFCYTEVFKKVNGHCSHGRNGWMAILRENFFNSPWAFISFLVVAMQLLLTFTQTVFSVLSYVNHK